MTKETKLQPLDEYGADKIRVLEGLTAVRKRPAMYIGSQGLDGLHHLVYEVVDNAIDEALAGYCDKIDVVIGAAGTITVDDNGRGIPVDMHKTEKMPAVEVVRHKKISEEALGFTTDVLTNMGKKPFVATDVSGFWVNKHLMPFMYDTYRALERGEISVADGDWGLKGSLGHPQGVFKLSDFIGMDTMYRVGIAMYLATQDPRLYPPLIVFRMISRNELGVKTGKGFYEWDGYKIVKPRDFSDLVIKDSNEMIILKS